MISLSGKWDIRDGDQPGEGQVVGFVQAFDAGMIEVKIDGYMSPSAAEHLRIQLMAAINVARGRTP